VGPAASGGQAFVPVHAFGGGVPRDAEARIRLPLIEDSSMRSQRRSSREDSTDWAAVRLRDVERVEGFSDGVFAFAATLLVLGIRIPRPTDADAATGLLRILLDQWPSYLVFAISFTVVGTVWANHRLAFSHLVRSDHILVSLNVVQLMLVAFLPVPTAVLGSWLSSDQNRLAAVLFFSSTLTVLGLFHNLLWWYAAYWGRLTAPGFPADKRRSLTLRWVWGPVLYALGVALAFLDPWLSVVLFVLIGIFFLLPTPRILREAGLERVRRSTAEPD
jgi:uncharacterized membrane protein